MSADTLENVLFDTEQKMTLLSGIVLGIGGIKTSGLDAQELASAAVDLAREVQQFLKSLRELPASVLLKPLQQPGATSPTLDKLPAERVALRTAPLMPNERAGSREALTLKARLQAAHECTQPGKGFEQLPRPDGDAPRQWRCNGCSAIVTLPPAKDVKKK